MTMQAFIHAFSKPLSTRSSLSRTSLRPHLRQYSCQPKASALQSSKSPKGKESQAQLFRLSPSDFAFLWNECKRCFYLKSHGTLYRPRAPFPSIFGTIDVAMKRHFRGLRTTDVLPEMRPGVFLCEEQDAWVESKPIFPSNSDHNNGVFIRGMIDCLVQYDDGTYGIIDFKTSSLSSKSIAMYARQLHAYAAALEDPSSGSELQKCQISDLGLIIYNPANFHTPLGDSEEDQRDLDTVAAALTGNLKYMSVPRNDKQFYEFLTSIVDVLTLSSPPSAPPPSSKSSYSYSCESSCPYCDYVAKVSKLKLQ